MDYTKDMAKIDLKKISKKVFSKPDFEQKIKDWKEFYRRYLFGLKNHTVKSAVDDLYVLLNRHKKIEPGLGIIVRQDVLDLKAETENTLTYYFGNEILNLYNRPITVPREHSGLQNSNDGALLRMLEGFSQAITSAAEREKLELEYKTNFLGFVYNCLKQFGLHPAIDMRDEKKYKRYNVVLEHNYKSPKARQKEVRVLLSADELQAEFRDPYERQLPIKVGGKLVPFRDIYQIQISSTLLLDDEIELFAKKNGFLWTGSSRSYDEFVTNCKDETDAVLRNPYLIEKEKGVYRSQNVDFVNPTRIAELKKLKSKTFDLVKLVRLCEELNLVASVGSHLSSSMVLRAVIDHVPPVFGFQTFAEVANNYNGGTKSFKKSMMNLNGSLRNIADNNIHSQVREKEVLPTSTQVDFSPELDLLLGEIVRILK